MYRITFVRSIDHCGGVTGYKAAQVRYRVPKDDSQSSYFYQNCEHRLKEDQIRETLRTIQSSLQNSLCICLLSKT